MGCYFRPLVAYLQAHRLAVLFRRIDGNLDCRNVAEVGNEPQVTKGGRAVNQNKKPSEPVEEERRAELEQLDKELELQLQINKDIQELSGMIELQMKANRERNKEYQKIMLITIACQSIALLFALASLITTVVKVAL